ncbi:MAG: type VI secretion system ATPase TssH, partial [Planctomycetota bacterium]|nr:type VI secretion system ATPase TssH [Planctomycetota bacterium]
RIDEKIVFQPLSTNELERVVDLQLEQVAKRALEKQIKITFADQARSAIVEQSYDPGFGARPVKRFIQQHIENLLAKELLRESVGPDRDVVIAFDGAFRVEVRSKTAA